MWHNQKKRIQNMKKLILAAMALSLMAAPCWISTEAHAAKTTPAVASGTKAPKASKAKAPDKAKKASAKAPAKAKKPTAKKKTQAI
jgi:hypothetical protein